MTSPKTRGDASGRRPATKSDRYLRLLESLSPLVGSRNVEELCTSACAIVADVLEVEACSILLLDSPTSHLALISATHIPKADWKSVHLPIDSGICGSAFSTGKSLLLRKQSDFAAFGMKPVSRYGKASCVVSPLFIRNAPGGVLNIANPKDGRLFSTRDVELIEAGCRLIAGGILNAYQFRESIQIHEHLEGIFDNLHVGVLALNMDLSVTHSNHRLRELLGAPDTPLKGRSLKDVLPPAVYNVARRLIRHSSEKGGVGQDRMTGTLGGVERALQMTASRVNHSGIAQSDSLLMVEDVGLDEEVKRLREADSAKTGFLRIISHELRTPLTVIRGVVPLLESCKCSPDGANVETLAKVEQLVRANVFKLTGLVNTILDVVEIEDGSLKLRTQPIDLNALLKERIDMVTHAASMKKIEWRLELDPSLPAVAADRQHFGQTLHELLDNAIKFTPIGSDITIQTSRDGPMAAIRIANRGGTIPEKERESVFEKFYQVDTSSTRKRGGSGLGLYLARNVAALHGGSLSIVDGEGDQAVFLLKVPLAAEVKGTQ